MTDLSGPRDDLRPGADAARAVPAPLRAELTALLSRTRAYAGRSVEPATQRKYRTAWEDFTLWCERFTLPALPATPLTISLYCADLADGGLAVSTLGLRLAAIRKAHETAGHTPPPTADPVVKATLAGIRRSVGTAPRRQVAPVLTANLRAALTATPADEDQLLQARDRALVLLGFAGGFRRSALVALDVADLEPVNEGLRVHIRRDKTDPEAKGRVIGIPRGRSADTCPVLALQRWLRLAEISSGPVFRAVDRWQHVGSARLSDRAVARVVQRLAPRAGLDPALVAGHSLRAGLATSAAEGGAEERKIQEMTGHASAAMLRRYIRSGQLFQGNAASKAGL